MSLDLGISPRNITFQQHEAFSYRGQQQIGSIREQICKPNYSIQPVSLTGIQSHRLRRKQKHLKERKVKNCKPYCRIAVRCNPNAGKVVGVDFIFDELATSIFMNVDSSRLTMMDVTFDDGRIGTGLYLKSGNAVIVNLIIFKVALSHTFNFINHNLP